jgi:nitronate monooxygenase
LGAGYLAADQIRAVIRETRKLTDKPFGVNLFIFEQPTDAPEKIEQINHFMQPYRDELGIGKPPELKQYASPFDEQMAVILEEKVPAFSFTFGALPAYWLQKLKEAGIVVMGTATTVREGLELEKAGVDIIVGQGYEAGGHRGTFLGEVESSLVGTIALIPQLVDTLKVPVVAAGGIMDGRGVVAAIALGAVGVQMGTAFLACTESGAHPVYKESLLQSTEESTVLTRTFSGKPVRTVRNRFTTEMETHAAALPDYPIQNSLTRDLRQAAAQQKRPEFMSLLAGQGSRLCTTRSAQEIVADTVKQVNTLLDSFK